MSRRDHDISRNQHDRREKGPRSRARPSGGQHPRHQQAPWQDGNYYQSNNYHNNFQYQNSPSSYSHNPPWGRIQNFDQQWRGYNQPYSTPNQWRSQNPQHVTPQNFNPNNLQPSQPQHNKPTGNPNITQPVVKENPPLGSKEDRERALEESKDRLKKSLRECKDKQSNNSEEKKDDQIQPIAGSTGRVRPRTTLVKTVEETSTDEMVPISGDAVPENQKHPRRSSLESKNAISSETIHEVLSKSPALNRRSRSTSFNSSSPSSSKMSDSHVGLPEASNEQSSKEAQAAKQRVIKELLSMSKVKLKEIVSNPRSRKFEFVMKYMMKESRTQQSYKQRQLAQAGIQGHNTLAQQDYEALLSDPDLAVSLSNLPAEMIETLESIFQLNSLKSEETASLAVGDGLLEENLDPFALGTKLEISCDSISYNFDSPTFKQSNETDLRVSNKIENTHKAKPDFDQTFAHKLDSLETTTATTSCTADSFEDCLFAQTEQSSVTSTSSMTLPVAESLGEIPLTQQSFESCTEFTMNQIPTEKAHRESENSHLLVTLEDNSVNVAFDANVLTPHNTDNVMAVSSRENYDLPLATTGLPTGVTSIMPQLPEKIVFPPCDFTKDISVAHQTLDQMSMTVNYTKHSSIIEAAVSEDAFVVPDTPSEVTPADESTNSHPISEVLDPIEGGNVSLVNTDDSFIAPPTNHLKTNTLDDISSQETVNSEPSTDSIDQYSTQCKHVTPKESTSVEIEHPSEDCITSSPAPKLSEDTLSSRVSSSPADVLQSNVSLSAKPLNDSFLSSEQEIPIPEVSEPSVYETSKRDSDVDMYRSIKDASVTSESLDNVYMVCDYDKHLNVDSRPSISPHVSGGATFDSTDHQEAPETTFESVEVEVNCQKSIGILNPPSGLFIEHDPSVTSGMKKLPSSSPKPTMMETENNLVNPKCRPMHILLESIDLAEPGAKTSDSSRSLHVNSDNRSDMTDHDNNLCKVVDVYVSPDHILVETNTEIEVVNQVCGKPDIVMEINTVHVKSESEEVQVDSSLDSNLPYNCGKLTVHHGNEVSTQTEDSPNIKTNLVNMLHMIEEACQNTSQLVAFRNLKEMILTSSTTANIDSHQSLLSQSKVELLGKKHTRSRPHAIIQKQTKSIPATSDDNCVDVQDSITSNQCNEIPHSAILNDLSNQNTCSLATDLESVPSENVINPQEKLKDLFHKITRIENQIETWTEMKKKLYEKVNLILEDEKAQCSSSSEQTASIVEGTTPAIKQTPISIIRSSRQLRGNSRRKNRKNNVFYQSSVSLPPTVSFPVQLDRDETKMNISVDKPIVLSHEMAIGLNLTKVKEENIAISSNKSSPPPNKSKLKRKGRSTRHPKRVTKVQVSLLKSNVASPPSSISPTGKRSSRNLRPTSGVKIDKELVVLSNTSKERSQRNIRKRVEKESPVLSYATEEILPRSSRRRIAKELDFPSSRSEESLSRASNNGRTRRSQHGISTNEESFELCVLSTNISRRTKGERKEMFSSKPNEIQFVDGINDQGLQRRATRQSISEPLLQELILPEVKRGQKRKAELEWNSTPENPLTKTVNPALPTIRGCSVVLEPLAPHLKKQTKESSKPDNCHSLSDEEENVDSENISFITELPHKAVPPLSIVLSSDDDDVPLFQIKQNDQGVFDAPLISGITTVKTDTDQHSVSSSDTVQDLGMDDPEFETDDSHSRSKKNKPKKLKKRRQSDHSFNLEFADHHRGVILDLKVVGRHVLAASEDGSVYSYSIKSGKLKKKYEGHQAAVTCLCVIAGEHRSEKSCPEKVVTGSLDDHVRCFYFKTAELVNTPLKIGTALCVDHNWGVIYLGTKLGEVVKVNDKTLTKIGEHMKFSSESILALKATKEGPRKVLVVGTRDQPIAIRDADTGLFLRTVSGEWHHTVCSLLLDKSLVYCGTMSGPIPVFDFTNGREMFQFNAGVGVRCIKIYNGLLFAGCYDGNLYIYNIQDQSLITTLTGTGKMILCLDIARNKIIYSCKDALQALNFPPEVAKIIKEAKIK